RPPPRKPAPTTATFKGRPRRFSRRSKSAKTFMRNVSAQLSCRRRRGVRPDGSGARHALEKLSVPPADPRDAVGLRGRSSGFAKACAERSVIEQSQELGSPLFDGVREEELFAIRAAVRAPGERGA